MGEAILKGVNNEGDVGVPSVDEGAGTGVEIVCWVGWYQVAIARGEEVWLSEKFFCKGDTAMKGESVLWRSVVGMFVDRTAICPYFMGEG